MYIGVLNFNIFSIAKTVTLRTLPPKSTMNAVKTSFPPKARPALSLDSKHRLVYVNWSRTRHRIPRSRIISRLKHFQSALNGLEKASFKIKYDYEV